MASVLNAMTLCQYIQSSQAPVPLLAHVMDRQLIEQDSHG